MLDPCILTAVECAQRNDDYAQPQITYHDDTGEMREVYIAMDDDDLITLRGLVDRAEEKVNSLRAAFATANIEVVTP